MPNVTESPAAEQTQTSATSGTMPICPSPAIAPPSITAHSPGNTSVTGGIAVSRNAIAPMNG